MYINAESMVYFQMKKKFNNVLQLKSYQYSFNYRYEVIYVVTDMILSIRFT